MKIMYIVPRQIATWKKMRQIDDLSHRHTVKRSLPLIHAPHPAAYCVHDKTVVVINRQKKNIVNMMLHSCIACV